MQAMVVVAVLLTVLFGLVGALPHGTAWPSQRPAQHFQVEGVTLNSGTIGRYSFVTEMASQPGSQLGLSLWSFEKNSQKGETSEVGLIDRLEVEVKEGSTQINLHVSATWPNEYQLLKLTILIVAPAILSELVVFSNIRLQFDQEFSLLDSNFLRYFKQIDPSTARMHHFLQGFTTSGEETFKKWNVELNAENWTVTARNGEPFGEMVVTIVVFSERGRTMLLDFLGVRRMNPAYALVRSYEDDGARVWVAVELKCPMSFRYFNATSRLCQFECPP
jgi:hypothetical protein